MNRTGSRKDGTRTGRNEEFQVREFPWRSAISASVPSIVRRIESIDRHREDRLLRRCFERTAPRRPRHLRAPTSTPGRRQFSIKVPIDHIYIYIHQSCIHVYIFISVFYSPRLDSLRCITQRAQVGTHIRTCVCLGLLRAIFRATPRNFATPRGAAPAPRLVASQRVTQSRRSVRFRTEGSPRRRRRRRRRAPRPRDCCVFFLRTSRRAPYHIAPRCVSGSRAAVSEHDMTTRCNIAPPSDGDVVFRARDVCSCGGGVGRWTGRR